jgi:flavin-dependent dehydrogenase
MLSLSEPDLPGCNAPKLLSRRGAKILLVDRKVDLTRGIHTTGIFVRKTLEDFDFPAGTLGKAVRKVSLYSPKLKKLELQSEKDEFRIGRMGLIYRNFLQECLENGVEFKFGTRYVSAEMLKDETIVKLEKKGVEYEIKTKVLVGADGANSRVAKDLKLDENKEWIVGYEEVFHSTNSNREPLLHCFLDARLAPGYLAWIADDGEEIHIGVGGYAANFNPREALKLFKEKTANLFDLKNAKLGETRGGRIPVGGVLRKIANETGLLIGDAAGAVSPLTAGGLDPCLRLSAMAANVIWERLTSDDSKVLVKFSGELFRARFISRLWMRRIISIFTNQTLLELGFTFLLGRVGRRIAKHIFFGRGSFPDVEIQTSKQRVEII